MRFPQYSEAVFLSKTERFRCILLRGDRHDVIVQLISGDSCPSKPLADHFCVHHRFACAETLRGNDCKRRFGAATAQNPVEQRAINRGKKVKVDLRIQRLQCMPHGVRPHFGAADTDVDHVGDPSFAADPLGKAEHSLALRKNFFIKRG